MKKHPSKENTLLQSEEDIKCTLRQVKACLGFTRFSVREHSKLESETNLVFMANNLRKYNESKQLERNKIEKAASLYIYRMTQLLYYFRLVWVPLALASLSIWKLFLSGRNEYSDFVHFFFVSIFQKTTSKDNPYPVAIIP